MLMEEEVTVLLTLEYIQSYASIYYNDEEIAVYHYLHLNREGLVNEKRLIINGCSDFFIRM
jgi:sarcosine oxidase delta subunit